jgi:DNA-binding NarL/FixJ family response regulator
VSTVIKNDEKEKRVLIVEDHSIVAFAIASLLAKIDSSISVTVCRSAKAAKAEFANGGDWFRIFIDIGTPDAHGLSMARYFAEHNAGGRCVIYGAGCNPNWIVVARRMGLLGYVMKTASNEDFISALYDIVAGKHVFPAIPENIEKYAQPQLTRRQLDVLCLLQRGYSTKKIASQLHLNPGTVDNHVSSLLRTLSVSSRTHAVSKAIELGYIAMASFL